MAGVASAASSAPPTKWTESPGVFAGSFPALQLGVLKTQVTTSGTRAKELPLRVPLQHQCAQKWRRALPGASPTKMGLHGSQGALKLPRKFVNLGLPLGEPSTNRRLAVPTLNRWAYGHSPSDILARRWAGPGIDQAALVAAPLGG